MESLADRNTQVGTETDYAGPGLPIEQVQFEVFRNGRGYSSGGRANEEKNFSFES